jgi:hypothetical protein
MSTPAELSDATRMRRYLEAGIQSGLASIRTLHENGYGPYRPHEIAALDFPTQGVVTRMFEEARLSRARKLDHQASLAAAAPENDSEKEAANRQAQALRDSAGQWAGADERLTRESFAEAAVLLPLHHLAHPDLMPEAHRTQPRWTILEENAPASLDQLARDIVLLGPQQALDAVPLGQFNRLLTVERGEIESFRSVRNLIAEYDRSENQKRPLSLAVFGPPGAGKSFGVTQVARSLFPERIEPLTFNLSQFSSADDLLAALHQVRDVSLSGKLPLVFWDEFDTSLGEMPLGWLRLFLAPMQDGAFQEGQVTHPIGKAVFVFAGGTATSMEAFRDRPAEEQAAFRNAKGPDFVSRLKGYVNIMGPNPGANGDLQYVVRRAILLRNMLGNKAPQIFDDPVRAQGRVNIDAGILNAFLKIGAYRHGARSMEAVIDMSTLAGHTRFERSNLPDDAQLELHVDSREFMARVQEVVIDSKELERLAAAAHAVYRRETKPIKPYQDCEFKDLLKEDQEQNREAARDIPTKLNLAGYVMIKSRDKDPDFAFPGDTLEGLAEWEHVRWMKEKLARGWLYGPETDRAIRRNNCLLAWSRLPELEKKKDRALVTNIPKILQAAGFTVFQLPEAARPRQKVRYQLEYHLTRVGVIGPDATMDRYGCFPYVRKSLKKIGKAFGPDGLAVITQLTTTAEQLAAERLLLIPGARLFVALTQESPEVACEGLPDEALRAGYRDACARADQLISAEQIAKWHAPGVDSDEKPLPPEMAYVLDHCDVLIAFCDESQPESATAGAVARARRDRLPLALIPAAPAPGKKVVRFENFPLEDANPQRSSTHD